MSATRAAVGLGLVVAALATVVSVAPASAAVEWNGEFSSAPTNMVPGERAGILVWPANAGDTMSSAFPTVTVALPPGVTLATGGNQFYWDCLGTSTVTCSLIFPFPVSPYAYTPIQLSLVVDVAESAVPGTYDVPVTFEGGDAAGPVTQTEQIIVGDEPTEFGIVPGSFSAGTFDEAGDPFTQAGGHPYEATAAFTLTTKFNDPADDPFNDSAWLQMVETSDHLKDAIVDVPAGFVGNATAVPKCRDIEAVRNQACPAASQVGVTTYDQRAAMGKRMSAVYNMEPDANLPAQFAFDIPSDQPVTLVPVVRSDGDWGLTVKARDISEANPVFNTSVTLWGVPADPSHDEQRCALPNEVTKTCVGVNSQGVPDIPSSSPPDIYEPHASTAARLPFLSNPTECTGDPETTSIHVSGWSNPPLFEADGDPQLSDSRWNTDTADAPPVTGCELLSFDPTLRLQPTVTKPDSPTGLEVDLGVAQNDDPDGLASAHLRDTKVVLPEGMTVNPSSADGLAGCTSAQIGMTSKSPARFTKLEPSCPAGSKIGTVEVDTPLLEAPLTGTVYLASQADNPFDSLLAMYIVVRGPGILGKLAGHITSDAQTGRLTTTVLENPQVPFDTLKLRLKSGPKAPLTTPSTCGTHTTTMELSSWAGQTAGLADSFDIDCPGTSTLFDPGFSAGATNPIAGAYSPFAARVTRSTGKELGRIDVKLPKGMLANLRNVAVCSEPSLAAAAAKPGRAVQTSPSCPATAQVGMVTAGAGSGPTPYFVRLPGSDASGRVFLTGAHDSPFPAPAGTNPLDYGLVAEVPAVAGPFDLGTVLVRVALYTDPETAEVTGVSDTLPRILQGIPLDIRDIRLNLDRAGFTVNPTSCAEKRIEASIRAQDGTPAARSARFQVGECAALGLKPRISIKLIGRKQTKTGGNPALQARLRQAGGQSNLSNVRVSLPLSLALDARNAGGDWLCSFEGGQRATCPASSRIGTATAYSPLLKRPVSGPIYFVKNIRVDKRTGRQIRTLPTLLFKLSGEADIVIRAKSSVVSNHLVSTFTNLPDARVARFDLRIRGGSKRGILAVTGKNANICNGKQVATSSIKGQNGKLQSQSISIKTPCPKSGKKR